MLNTYDAMIKKVLLKRVQANCLQYYFVGFFYSCIQTACVINKKIIYECMLHEKKYENKIGYVYMLKK